MFRRDLCRLRPIERSDLDMVLRWRNSERIRANMYTDHLITVEEHVAWFAMLQSREKPTFMIFEYQEEPLGVISIDQIDPASRSCHWGIYIGAESAPRGSGMSMGFLGLEYIFETLALGKVIGEAFAFNQASINFHRRLGFAEAGVLPRHIARNDSYLDVEVFEMIDEDWYKLKAGLEKTCFADGDA